MLKSGGCVKALAYRPADGDAMSPVGALEVRVGGGAVVEQNRSRERGVTLVSAESWEDVCRELGAEVGWLARRANVLVSGVDLASTIGKTLRIGDVELRIHGETKPCGIMDKSFAGLRQALTPACRGGVFGEVLRGGRIVVGAGVWILSSDSS